MADIKKAIEYAKNNPNSAFASELRKRIESGSLNAEMQAVNPVQEKTPNVIGRLKTSLSNTIDDSRQMIDEASSQFGTSRTLEGLAKNIAITGRTQLGATAKLSEGVGGVLNALVPTWLTDVVNKGSVALGDIGTQIRATNPELADQIGEAVNNPAINRVIQSLSDKAKSNPEAVSVISDTINTLMLGIFPEFAPKAGAIKSIATEGKIMLGDAVDATGAKISSTIGNIEKNTAGVKNRMIESVAADADEATKNMIRRSSPEEIDSLVKMQEARVADNTAPTLYEAVGEKMAEATKQLERQKKALGEQKATIINKAKNGLEDFTTETRTAILEINRSIKNDPTAKTFIEKLKNVKTKIEADKAIDELQDILYSGNKTMTIPTGSATDRTLKGILGKYNSALKDSLPSAYRNINEKSSELFNNIDVLNRALGEVVDGVALRGSSITKQFFSPSGAKSKELFKFIKEKTGIDLAKDATLARYVMELYNDPAARSLLGGNIPTSISSVMGRVVDFAGDKSGVVLKAQDALRKATIEKAKRLSR